MTFHVEVRRGSYYDSVTLLRVSQAVQQVSGVQQALVAMATVLNLDLFRDLGFDAQLLGAVTPNDLIVAVHAEHQALDAALEQVEHALETRPGRRGGSSGPAPPRTVGRAATRLNSADLALISVPGANAFVEAMDALRAGLHVMIFSDNVPVDQEIVLKAEGARRGLLVMGPDCGTAIIGGVGLGFANVCRPGPVGVVAASGTGAQQVCCLLDNAGVGIRNVLGVGGRDLTARVGGTGTSNALRAMDADAETDVIVVVSKPPDPAVADRIRQEAADCATPVILGFVGPGHTDLTDVATQVVERVGEGPVRPRTWDPFVMPEQAPGTLRGLFSGGTLCEEAMVIAAEALGPIASNVPLQPEWALDNDLDDAGHVMIDFGDDRLTHGRPHPMIDHSLRLARLRYEAERPGDHVILIDVVLGHGADTDPAAAIAPAIHQARELVEDRGDRLAVVVSLCGTNDDPQGTDRQGRRLADAGAVVHLSNARAAAEAVALVRGGER